MNFNDYEWLKVYEFQKFVGLNCILSDKVKIQTFSASKESLYRPI
jgi:hypothetical protein